MLCSFQDLKKLSTQRQRLVVACAHDEVVLDAVCMALEANIVRPILIGRLEEIQSILASMGQDTTRFEIVDAKTDEEAAALAVEKIKKGEADVLMKGLLDTKVLLKEVVNKETGIRDGGFLSHTSVFEFPGLDHLVFATDCAMVIAPTVDEKAKIIENALSLTKALGYEKPLVGIVSAAEKVNPKMQSTVDAELLKERFQDYKNAIVDGPFAIDNLVSMESVVHKGIKSPVAGRADVFLFPSIEAGNVFYKTSVFLANAKAAGLVLGAICPIVLTSRADSVESKFYSIYLAAVYSYEKNYSRN